MSVHDEVYSIQDYVIKSVICYKSVVFSGYSGFPTNKTDRHDITEILLKVSLNTLTLTHHYVRYTSQCLIYKTPRTFKMFLH